MRNVDILVFDIVGKMGHFRKFFSTTTALSYIFPPRTAILGIIGAILGLENYREVYQKLGNSLVGIEVVSPPRKVLITENYLMVKSVSARELRGKSQKTQITMEILLPEWKHITYRIYVHNEYIDDLNDRIHNNKSHFPIYLGITEFLAKAIKPKKIKMQVLTVNSEIETRSVVKFDRAKIINFEEGIRLYREERVPAELDGDRQPLRVEDYLVPVNGKIKIYYSDKIFSGSKNVVGIL